MDFFFRFNLGACGRREWGEGVARHLDSIAVTVPTPTTIAENDANLCASMIRPAHVRRLPETVLSYRKPPKGEMVPTRACLFIGSLHHLSQDDTRTYFSYQHDRHLEEDSFAYWWADPYQQRMERIFLEVFFESAY
jgi:hypothetical protein